LEGRSRRITGGLMLIGRLDRLFSFDLRFRDGFRLERRRNGIWRWIDGNVRIVGERVRSDVTDLEESPTTSGDQLWSDRTK